MIERKKKGKGNRNRQWPGDAKALSTRASVNEQFVEAASTAMQASDLLDGASPATAEALRDAIVFALAYEAALTESRAFERAMAHTIRAAKAAAGGRALDIYAIGAPSGEKYGRRRARAACPGHAAQAPARTSEGDLATRSRLIRDHGAETVV